MQKKGLSTVVVSLILILLTLVAIGIIWVVIKNILSKGTDEIALGKFTLDLKINKNSLIVDPIDGSVKINVKRNPGAGDLVGLKFIGSDGTNSKVIEKKGTAFPGLEELDEKQFTLTSEELSGLAFVKTISIAPILKSDSGKETYGDVIDSYTISSSQEIQTLKNNPNLVAWYRMEGDANDEKGANNGEKQGTVTFVPSKDGLGKAGNFDGADANYIKIDYNPALNVYTDSSWAFSAWIKPVSGTGTYRHIIYGPWTNLPRIDYHETRGGLLLLSPNPLGFWSNQVGFPDINFDQWNYLTLVANGTNYIWYINGVERSKQDYLALANNPPGSYGLGGGGLAGTNFKGQIDEVMIYDDALTPQEVQALYNARFS